MSNMYQWVTYTWNPVAGECPHRCEYCYVPKVAARYPGLREKYSGPPRLDQKALNARIPKQKTVFVCSMNDLFAAEIPDDIIQAVLKVTRKYEYSEYLFQTKNPGRLKQYINLFPKIALFGTTIETNRDIIRTRAPPPEKRYRDFKEFVMLARNESHSWRYMVNIEPVVDFDLDVLLEWLRDIAPHFVSIGADSKHNNLPEPDADKVCELMRELQKTINVSVKPNLGRIIGRDAVEQGCS